MSSLDPKLILAIDKARMNGASAQDIHQSLELAGHDADEAFKAYASHPFADGRPRGQVNLGDPDEWGTGG